MSLKDQYLLFIVTHQPGIAKGIVSEKEVRRINRYVVKRLAGRNIPIQEVYCCPHASEGDCLCLKPRPYFLHLAAQKYGIDLHRSFIVGDHPHDVHMAWNAGARGLYVLTGHGAKHQKELTGRETIVRNIREAALWILGFKDD